MSSTPQPYAPDTLLLNPDGSIYHLRLHPGELATRIILVGDPNRAHHISTHLHAVHVFVTKREFVTYTGLYKEQPLSIIGTGMGTSNIDIVVNELDALFNIDFETRLPHAQHTQLDLIRLGTAGGIHPDISPGQVAISYGAIGFDNVLDFYETPPNPQAEQTRLDFQQQFDPQGTMPAYYCTYANTDLVTRYQDIGLVGWTLTSPSFYGGQSRALRIPLQSHVMLDQAAPIQLEGLPILNCEMETAPLLALAQLFGHRACSLSTIVTNRLSHTICDQIEEAIEKMLMAALN